MQPQPQFLSQLRLQSLESWDWALLLVADGSRTKKRINNLPRADNEQLSVFLPRQIRSTIQLRRFLNRLIVSIFNIDLIVDFSQ